MTTEAKTLTPENEATYRKHVAYHSPYSWEAQLFATLDAERTKLKAAEDRLGYDPSADMDVVDANALLLAEVARLEAEHARLRAAPFDCNYELDRLPLIHALTHIAAMDCESDHDVDMSPCARRTAKEAIDNRPCSLCAQAVAPGVTEADADACTCARIQAADATRHFRECPKRAEYPEPAKAVPQLASTSAPSIPRDIFDVIEAMTSTSAGPTSNPTRAERARLRAWLLPDSLHQPRPPFRTRQELDRIQHVSIWIDVADWVQHRLPGAAAIAHAIRGRAREIDLGEVDSRFTIRK